MYSYPDNIPDYIKNLPEGAQKLFVKVFNSELADSNDEDKARQAGWGAVKNAYEKQDDKWVKKAGEQILRYVANLADVKWDAKDGSLVSVVQVFRTGVFRHPIYGKFTIADDDLEKMVINFKAKRPKPPTELVVDYEHMSTMPGKAPAAGWVKALEHKPGELLATIEWTATARDHISKKEYKFISPEWNMHYKDKETGKDAGPCLMSVALTNRPFFEGMRPVVMSENLEVANSEVMVLSERMIGSYVPSGAAQMAAEWDTEYINDLPDKCFAYIEPDGEKDEDGKTVPRSLRHLPYRKADGAVDLPHLRNALARLDQTELSPEAKAKAKSVLDKAAEEAGVGDGEQENEKAKEGTLNEQRIREILGIGPDDDIVAAVQALLDKVKEAGDGQQAQEPVPDEQRIREILGITEDADIEAAIQALVDKVKEAEAKKQENETIQQAREIDADVVKALANRLILPRQTEWARSLRAKDPAAFKAFTESASPVGPPLEPPKGNEGVIENIKLSEAEMDIGRKMGVSTEKLMEQKKRDAAMA